MPRKKSPYRTIFWAVFFLGYAKFAIESGTPVLNKASTTYYAFVER